MNAARFRPTAAQLATVLLCAALLVACRPADVLESQEVAAQTVPDATPQRSDLRQVRVARAESGALTTTRSTSVTVEPGREALVAAGTSGQVEAVVVREGGDVQQGDPVVRLVDSNLRLQVENARLSLQTARVNLEAARRASSEGEAQARSALEAARSNLDVINRQYAEAQELLELGAIASSEVAGLEAQLAQARSSFQQAEAALSRSQRAGVEELELRRLQVEQAENGLAQAQLALAEAVVDAPFAGSIARVMVEEGEFIGAGSPAFRLVSNEQQQVRFSVPPSDAVSLLQQGLIHIPYGGLTYAAQITNSSNVPGDTRLVELTAVIYPSETVIPTGAVARLTYEVTLARGVVVPVEALGVRQGEAYVLVVENGATDERPVEILAETAGEAVVEGVSPDSLVVSPLPPDLLDDFQVEVVGGEAGQ